MTDASDEIPGRRARREASVAPDLAAVDDAVETLPAPPAAAVPPRPVPPVVEAPSDDVAAVPAASRIPGAPHAGYATLPTAPVVTLATGPVEGDVAEIDGVSGPRPVVAPWALGLAIVALLASFFLGWMLPLGLAAVVTAIVALRRPIESRPLALWALVLGALSLVYSAGWLVWVLPQLPAA
jgi:hypothetical protein